MVQEGFKRLLVDDLEPLHHSLAVQVVYNSQRQTSNVRDYVVKLVGCLVELFFVGFDDLGNILTGFQNHSVIRVMSNGDRVIVYRE